MTHHTDDPIDPVSGAACPACGSTEAPLDGAARSRLVGDMPAVRHRIPPRRPTTGRPTMSTHLAAPATDFWPLTIDYSGAPVSVHASHITSDMRVPDLGDETSPDNDHPAAVAASLFCDALVAGALVPPDGVTIHCYGTDDHDASVVALVAYTQGSLRRGVTSGWRDVGTIARLSPHDPRPASHPDLVQEALQFFAAELNYALGVQAERR